MKLSRLILCFLCLGLGNVSDAFAAADAGLRYIQTRGTVRCGTDLHSKFYAYKDEDGFWHGFDADICKAISLAVFNRSDRFTMVNVSQEDITRALSTNKIDVMLSSAPFSAEREITYKSMPVDILYYDQQMFLARKIEGATSMEAYKGAKVCVVSDTDDYHNLVNYSRAYKLDLVPLPFKLQQRATEAFLLNRCPLLTGNAIYLKNILTARFDGSKNVELLPESIALKPVYAIVAKDNNTLRIIVKWIFNALKLAEEHNINSKNVNVYIGSKDISVQNLLGDNPHLWNKFGLNPNWLRKAIEDLGNYGEIYERNIGKDSPLMMERRENNLLRNRGLISSQPFL